MVCRCELSQLLYTTIKCLLLLLLVVLLLLVLVLLFHVTVLVLHVLLLPGWLSHSGVEQHA